MSPPPDATSSTRTTRTVLVAATVALAAALLAPTGGATAIYHHDGCVTYHYVVGGVPYADIPASLAPGSPIAVNFTLSDCTRTLSFVSYNATQAVNPPLPPQTVYSSQTGSFSGGTHELTITVPPCFYQLDFVYGAVITTFDPEHGVTYHDQERFIDGSTGGNACVTSSSSTTSTSETTTTTSETETTTNEIPFFPAASALGLGLLGAVIAGLMMLRRRL